MVRLGRSEQDARSHDNRGPMEGLERRLDHVRTICRLRLRAWLFAGRFPWLAFLTLCCGFDMTEYARLAAVSKAGDEVHKPTV